MLVAQGGLTPPLALAAKAALAPLVPMSARTAPTALAGTQGTARAQTPSAAVPGTPRTALLGLSAEVVSAGDTVTVVLYGELDAVTAPILRTMLAQLPDPQPARITFELAGLSFTDCAGARLIGGLGPRSAGASPPTASPRIIRHARPAVRRVFELLGLDAVWLIDPELCSRRSRRYLLAIV